MEYSAYGERWLFLAVICVGTATGTYVTLSFEVVNDVVTEYFKTTPYGTDILSTVVKLSSFFACGVMVFLGEQLGIRSQLLVIAISVFLGNAMCAIGFSGRTFYWTALSGHAILGISDALFCVLPSIFANVWFPPKETATAYAMSYSSTWIGRLLSTVAFPLLLPSFRMNTTAVESVKTDDEDANRVRVVFVANFAAIALSMLVIAVLMFIYARDRPPTPPSASQEKIWSLEVANNPTFRQRLVDVITCFRNTSFTLITAANFLSDSVVILTAFLATSTIRSTFPNLDNRTPGYVTTIATAMAVVGGILCGRLLDRFGHYKPFAVAATLVNIASSLGLYIGHRFSSLEAIFVLYPLLSLSRSFASTTRIELLVETTYPGNSAVLTPLYFMFNSMGMFVFTALMRQIMTSWGVESAILVPLAANVLSLILIMIVKPIYKRSEANISGILYHESENEKSKLLPEK